MALTVDENLKLKVSEEVAIEDFTDGSIVFLAEQLRLLEINRSAKHILEQMDGRKSVDDIIRNVSSDLNRNQENIREEFVEVISDFISDGVLIPDVKLEYNGEIHMSDKKRFMANPDVSCRIEDEDGAILFNPDSDSTQVINPIGLDIWRSLERHPRALSEVVSHIIEIYENVPTKNVKEDVEGFIMNLHSKGFIGEVVDDKE